MPSSVTSKGQVTIPKKIRDLLGIRAGSVVRFRVDVDGRVTLHKIGGRKNPRSRFARLRGTASVRMRTDEIMALTRGID